METLCPYCRERPCDTDDHVFSRFLGGHATIRSCRRCNNDKFGSGFEGSVSRDLAPIIVFLSFSGLQPRKTVVHKKAWVDTATGYEYDIDSNRRSTIANPQLIKDDDGKVSQ